MDDVMESRIGQQPEQNNAPDQRIREFLQDTTGKISVFDIKRGMDDLTLSVLEENPTATALDTYRQIAKRLPHFLPSTAQDKILKAIADKENPDIAITGTQLLGLINMKSILIGIEPYFENDPDFNDELVHEAFGGVLRLASSFKHPDNVAPEINEVAKRTVTSYIANTEGISTELVLQNKHKQVISAVNNLLAKGRNLTREEMVEFSEALGEKIGFNFKSIYTYLQNRFKMFPSLPPDRSDPVPDEAFAKLRIEDIQEILDEVFPHTKDPTHTRELLEKKYGLRESAMITSDIGKELGVSFAEVDRHAKKGIRNLRTSDQISQLTEYVSPNRTGPGTNLETRRTLPDLDIRERLNQGDTSKTGQNERKVNSDTRIYSILGKNQLESVLSEKGITYLYQFLNIAPDLRVGEGRLTSEQITTGINTVLERLVKDKSLSTLGFHSYSSHPSDSFLNAVTDDLYRKEGKKALQGLHITARIYLEKLWGTYNSLEHKQDDIDRLAYITPRRGTEIEREARMRMFKRQIERVFGHLISLALS